MALPTQKDITSIDVSIVPFGKIVERGISV